MKVEAVKTRVDLLIEYLNSLPDDEVFKGSELEGVLNFPVRSTSAIKAVRHTKLKDYCEPVICAGGGNTWFYGNPNAIRKLREKKNEN